MPARWPSLLRPPRQVLTFYLVGVTAAVVCLGWLGWRLLGQERLVQAQRTSERLEVAADHAARTLQRGLDDLERALKPHAGVPDHVVVVSLDGRTVTVEPPGRLTFHPYAPVSSPVSLDVFAAAERAEFADRDLDRAAALYRLMAASPDRRVEAEAYMRLGRVLRKGRHTDAAVKIYDGLAALDGTPAGGRPAGLVAREGRCSALEEAGQRSRLAGEAQALKRELASGRWPLTAGQWDAARAEAEAWLGSASAATMAEDEAAALSAAVASLWEGRATLTPTGRTMVMPAGHPVLAAWETGTDRIAIALAGREFLDAWRQRAEAESDVHVALVDGQGRTILGIADGQAVRTMAEARLPFGVRVSAADTARDTADATSRRTLLAVALALVGALIAGSTYFTLRGMHRELQAARLQSDFVSAVSHEFRTPLTSLRQLSQMLSQGRVIHEDRRQQYYDVLVRESERLHRLVERLLTFGRAESGVARYRMEPLDLGDLTRAVVEEFQRQAEPWRIELTITGATCLIHGDRELLGLALWNLLDNAVKYSPDCQTVWVEVSRRVGRLAVSVRDQGMGIPADEQARVFTKFVRGTQTASSAIKGTGIGLALVQHVAEAHGGTVRLASEVGRGSTFTLELPGHETE